MPRSPKTIISELTLIPVSLLFVIASLVFWSATMYQRVLANESAIEDIVNEREASVEKIDEIRESMGRLEGKVDVLMQRSGRR